MIRQSFLVTAGMAFADTRNASHTTGDFVLIGRVGALCGNVLRVSGRFFASEHAIVVTPAKSSDVAFLAIALARMNLNRLSELFLRNQS